MPADDAARFLAGSPDRLRLLSHLRERPGTPSDVADAVSLSHRSVQRTLAALVERGWAEKDAGEYRLTTVGSLLAREHAAYLDVLSTVGHLQPFYEHLPDEDHAPDPRWLDDADAAVATPANPQAPVHHYIESLRSFSTDEVRMLSPVLSRLFHDAHAELALDGVRTELVLSAANVRRARSLNPAEFAVVLATGRLSLYRHPGSLGVGLTLGADRALVAAYDDDGQLRACVASTHPDLLDWAAGLYERYRDRSDAVSPPSPFSRG